MKTQLPALNKQGVKPVALSLLLDDEGVACSRHPEPNRLSGDGGVARTLGAWGRLKKVLQPAVHRGHAEIVALWSPDLSTVKRAQAALGSLAASAQHYCGFSSLENEGEASCIMRAAPQTDGDPKTLEALLTADAEQSGIVLHLHHRTQERVLESVFRLLGDTVPLLSWGPPSFDPHTYTRLFALRSSAAKHEKRINGNKQKVEAPTKELTSKPAIWFVDEPMRFEPAINTVLNIIPDLGKVLGASLQMALLPVELTTWSGTLSPEGEGHFLTDEDRQRNSDNAIWGLSWAADRMKATCIAACAVLRRLLGDIQSLSCAPVGEPGASTCLSTQTDMTPPHVSGWIKFTNGTTSSVTIADTPFAPVFELVIAGTLGEVRLNWDTEKKCFMIQRYLQHYEHPLSHFPAGNGWYFEAWLESVREGCAALGAVASHSQSRENQNEAVWGVLHSMVDVAVAHAMRTSSGAVVVFRSVPAPQISQSKTVSVN